MILSERSHLEQESVNFFSKASYSKHFRLCGPVCHNYGILPLLHGSGHRQCINKGDILNPICPTTISIIQIKSEKVVLEFKNQ